jgi:penicillin-binding protein 2
MSDLDKYKITRFEEENLRPEETLADVSSEHTTIERPIGQGVFTLFYGLIGVVLLFFILKSFQLEILNGAHWKAVADQSSTSNYQLSPLRGTIYDSTGKPLVENLPSFDLIAVHSYLPKLADDLAQEVDQLSKLTGINQADLGQLFKQNENQAIFSIQKDIQKEEMIKIQTLALSGIYVADNSRINYKEGAAAAHLIGYTAPVSQDDLKNDDYYLLNDRIGRLGLESEYEQYLRGGHRILGFQNNGSEISQSPIESGKNLFLNVNSDVQEHLYQSLVSVFNSAGVKRGAAIAQDPITGAVLGLVSMPAFDPNVFENSSNQENSQKISQILANTSQPLLDRAVSGRYSPGSTIKPLLALAGLKEGVVTPTTTVNALGSISVRSEVDPNVFYTFRDWKVHGWTDLKKAIADSVDVYFYSLGGGYGNIKGLGINKIVTYLKSMLADKATGIDISGEVSGFVPTPEWKESVKGEPWYIGDTYNISIGQGDLLITPTWLNTYIGSIANGGKIMKPFIVKKITNPDGTIVKTTEPQILAEIPFDQNTIELVRQGMRQTVLSGTATLLQDVPAALAAKTGTAQVTGRGFNSLFSVFGPYDNPQITLTVLVENINQSQGLAIRVANDFLKWYFSDYQKSLTK